MIDRIRQLGERLHLESPSSEPEPFALLRAAAAQLLMATGAGATLERAGHSRPPERPAGRRPDVAAPLAWAPLLIGSLAALAHLEHVRSPSERTAGAVRVLDAATVTVGAALFLADLSRSDGGAAMRLGPLAFASAGLLGVTLERQETATHDSERELRRRAHVVERLVPRRKTRLDRVVVHV
ncbi:MAG: hypothetical protein WD766_04745 [Gemmatimonadota bacterium]